MSLDLSLLRALKYKERFDKVYNFVPDVGVDKKTVAILQSYEKYFNETGETKVHFESFTNLFFSKYHKGMSEDNQAIYRLLLAKLDEDAPERVVNTIINNLLELDYATKVANIIANYNEGEDVDVISDIDEITTRAKDSRQKAAGVAEDFADITDDASMAATDDDSGCLWPLACLNASYRRIQGGDQTIVAARPGIGKTTFLTHLNLTLAQGLPVDKCIVWFNNESRKERILQRQIQSALGATQVELQGWRADGSLVNRYIDVMGTVSRVRIFDIHGASSHELEDILEELGNSVGAIIFDMLDNVSFKIRGDMREDQRLEKMYQWSRELGVKYNCPVFPTSQVSNEALANLNTTMFPQEQMLKDSKTGKQGACDNILMIGFSTDPLEKEVNRYISMPKTKTLREGARPCLAQVKFDSARGRYIG